MFFSAGRRWTLPTSSCKSGLSAERPACEADLASRHRQYDFGARRTFNVSAGYQNSQILIHLTLKLTIHVPASGLQSGQFIDGFAVQVASPADLGLK